MGDSNAIGWPGYLHRKSPPMGCARSRSWKPGPNRQHGNDRGDKETACDTNPVVCWGDGLWQSYVPFILEIQHGSGSGVTDDAPDDHTAQDPPDPCDDVTHFSGHISGPPSGETVLVAVPAYCSPIICGSGCARISGTRQAAFVADRSCLMVPARNSGSARSTND
jgi:hypothetical protein